MKTETLDEAAEKYAEENAKDGNISYHNLYAPLEYAFRNGAEWQAKRMYSEEEVMDMFHNFSMHLPLHYEFLVKEQFKKK